MPGALTLIVIMLMALWLAWRRDDLAGRLAFVATLIMFIATSVNSALRDAQIGLTLLWVAKLALMPLRHSLAETFAPSATPSSSAPVPPDQR